MYVEIEFDVRKRTISENRICVVTHANIMFPSDVLLLEIITVHLLTLTLPVTTIDALQHFETG